jgi:hypothetical protein
MSVTDASPVRGLDVRVESDGSVVIHASATDAACLAGRDGFADRRTLQRDLEEGLAEAWYTAGCPPVGAGD